MVGKLKLVKAKRKQHHQIVTNLYNANNQIMLEEEEEDTVRTGLNTPHNFRDSHSVIKTFELKLN